MTWRGTQLESRQRYLAKYDAAEVEAYENWIRQLTVADDLACLQDIQQGFEFTGGMSVLDVGAGTGALCRTLLNVAGLQLTALEPVPAMLTQLKAKPELHVVRVVAGFCDSPDDRSLFAEASFDVIISRQLVNGLYDPLAAFQNWSHWLTPHGAVIVIDGLYDRSAWTGKWEEEADLLPMSACRSTAMTPYLLEAAGFCVDRVQFMEQTNRLPTTRTLRYITIARKPGVA